MNKQIGDEHNIIFYTDEDNNITLHIGNIYKEEELDETSTSKDSLLVQIEGNRSVKRNVKVYNL